MNSKTMLLFGVVILVIVGLVVTVQRRSLEQVRAENAALKEQARVLQEERAEWEVAAQRAKKKSSELDEAQIKELAKLRAEVARLRALAASAKSKKPTDSPSPSAETLEQALESKTVYPYRSRVPSGHTVLVGGWSTQPGRRTWATLQPTTVDAEQGGQTQVHVRALIFEANDAAFEELGLADLVDGNPSAQGKELAVEDASELEASLKKTDGVDVLAAPRVSTLSGRGAQISIQAGGHGIAVDVLPSASSDGRSIDLQFGVSGFGKIPQP
jgi:hypothetical protein